jgi:hypothetical protein
MFSHFSIPPEISIETERLGMSVEFDGDSVSE